MKDYYNWLERLIDAFEDQRIFDLVPKFEDSNENTKN